MKDNRNILYINACVREESRTDRLAKVLLDKLGKFEEIVLENADIRPLNRERLNKRTELLEKGDLDDEMFLQARQFADADIIVIAAPFWDNSFPAVLKAYIENIYVIGIVTAYAADGMPYGLCKAEKLYYVTTAGGPYKQEYGYGYIRGLALNRFGIRDTQLIYAENLDIIGNDAEEIMQKAIAEIDRNTTLS